MMWMILQAEQPDDWVIATGTTTTVREFVRMAFQELGIELEFKGDGENERAIIASCSNTDFNIETGKEVLSIDPAYYRPTEVDLLIGDSKKAKDELGWEPEYDLNYLVSDMVQTELRTFGKVD